MNAPDGEAASGWRASWRSCLSALPWLLPAVLVRLWFQLSGRCVLDSDEGIIGIQMLEALRGEFRVFFHGQDYLGTLPWILGSPGLLVFGANPNGLRFIYILYFVFVLLFWRGILRMLGAPGAWPWLAILLGVAPAFMVEYTLRSRGTIEGLLAGSLWLWIVVRILTDDRPLGDMRQWLFLLGLATGVSWWTTQLTAFFFILGAVLFFSDKRILGELRSFFSRPACMAWIVAFVLTGIVFLRATLHYRSPLQDLLWEMRGPLLLAWMVALLVAVVLAIRTLLPRWSILSLLGLILGYLPVLAVVWFKEEIYNTTSPQPVESLATNLQTFLLIGFLDLIGIGSTRSEWSLLTALAAIFAAGVMLSSVALATLGVVKALRKKQAPQRLDLFLVAACAWSVAFYCIAAPASSPLGHYGAFTGFFLMLAVSVFFWRLGLIHLWGSMAAAAALLAIHVASIAQAPRTAVEWRTGVEQLDAEVIRFLLDREITIAATSLNGSSSGYWEAYRLTFSSGERVRVHPILHMPRIDRYRTALKEAQRAAIVTTAPEMVSSVLEQEGIAFETETVGSMTILHGFDKEELDRRKLMDYRRRLDE